MAHFADFTSQPAANSGRLAALGARIANWFEAYTRHRARQPQIEALQAMSDAELAEIGLRRDQIFHFVFRDLMYL